MKPELNKRVKTKLFLVSFLIIFLGPILVGFLNQALDDQFQTEWVNLSPNQSSPIPKACLPHVDSTVYTALEQLCVTQDDDGTVSFRMANLMFADQVVRQIPAFFDPQKVSEKDALRRIEVLNLVKNGELHSGRNLVYAAFIFQHGDCSEHFQFANRLAQIAMEAGYTDAKWIFAASLDRYLMSIGMPQKYGTQYSWIAGEYQFYWVDPTTTDEERAEYNVPALGVAMNQEPQGNGSSALRKTWLETWWLTLIGAGFAALGAFIGVVDEKPNAPHGWMVVGISILLLLISAAGHYAQIKALSQGIIETQRRIWSTGNILMIIVWIAFVVFEGVRFVRENSAQPRL